MFTSLPGQPLPRVGGVALGFERRIGGRLGIAAGAEVGLERGDFAQEVMEEGWGVNHGYDGPRGSAFDRLILADGLVASLTTALSLSHVH